MTALPTQPAMFGFNPNWKALAAMFGGGIAGASMPNGNFAMGAAAGLNQYDQRQQAQQLAELRDIQIQQAQDEQNRANKEAADREAAYQQIAQAVGAGGINTASGPAMFNPTRQVGNYGASVGGAQQQPQAAMFSLTEPEKAIVLGQAKSDPAKAWALLQEFSTPQTQEPVKGVEMAGRLVNPYTGEVIADLSQEEIALRQASRPVTNISNILGGESPADAGMRKKLSEAEGERWSGLQGSGITASGMQQDFEALDQLMKVAPQGPIQGRLAEAFPGFSSAGDAFQSIVTRVAPSLRTPGSGATSDIEYEGMLRSLPRLRNQPEANKAIAEMMKAKASLNIERAAVVNAYQNEEISASDARKKLQELNSRSIMTPELKQAIEGVSGGATEVDGYTITPVD